jgi:hypothetical protein
MLMKWPILNAQTHNTFTIHDFVTTMNTYQGDLYHMYCNEQDKCGLKHFNQFLDIVEDCNDASHYG